VTRAKNATVFSNGAMPCGQEVTEEVYPRGNKSLIKKSGLAIRKREGEKIGSSFEKLKRVPCSRE